MLKQISLLILCAAAIVWFATPVQACTSAVVSGKVTPDGRPLLWKNRDTDFMRNHIDYVKGEKYNFIAVVNSANAYLKEAWMGTNSSGFALMNTQSYNLVDVKGDEERGAANGRVIYRALEVCATVEDFCHFLDTISKPSDIEANFGVIDAQGGAAMFEVDYHKCVMYDANNPKDAPYGYIARTNFSFAGKVNEGAGYVRYMEADQVLMKASATGSITPQFIFNDLSRSFRNRMLDIDLRSGAFLILGAELDIGPGAVAGVSLSGDINVQLRRSESFSKVFKTRVGEPLSPQSEISALISFAESVSTGLILERILGSRSFRLFSSVITAGADILPPFPERSV